MNLLFLQRFLDMCAFVYDYYRNNILENLILMLSNVCLLVIPLLKRVTYVGVLPSIVFCMDMTFCEY